MLVMTVLHVTLMQINYAQLQPFSPSPASNHFSNNFNVHIYLNVITADSLISTLLHYIILHYQKTITPNEVQKRDRNV